MKEELDIKSHPKVTVKRKLLGLDFDAGSVCIFAFVVFVICTGVAITTKLYLVFIPLGIILFFGLVLFALRFVNNKPKGYFSDYLTSYSNKHYIPKKYRYK